MKTNLQKIIAMLVAILLVVTVFAPLTSLAADDEETTSYTIKVTGDDLAGRTISVYKLFNITVSSDGTYTYDWDELTATQKFFAQYNIGTEENPVYLTTALEAAEYLKTLSTTQLTALAEEFYKFCSDNNYSAIATKTADNEGNNLVFDVTNYGAGYYLVYDETETLSGGHARSAAMLENVTGDVTVTLKADTVEVKKEVDKLSAAVGETVTFTITSEVPNTTGYSTYTFTVKDTLSEGLTYTDDSVKVTVGGEELDSSYYTVTSVVDEDGTTSLTITFDTTKFLELDIGDEIEIEYEAVVNSKAASYIESTNEVEIEYSNDPNTDGTGTTEEDKVYVYTYTVNFTKKDTSGNVLSGAEFILSTEINGTTNYIVIDSETGAVSYSTEESDATTFESDENGLFTIAGLSAGTYTLIEVVAPKGYSLPSFDGFTFTISQELNEDGSLKSATFDYISDEENSAAEGYIVDVTINEAVSFAVTVLNATDEYLPSTGGIGTKIFYTVGIIVMISAATVLVIRNRKNK